MGKLGQFIEVVKALSGSDTRALSTTLGVSTQWIAQLSAAGNCELKTIEKLLSVVPVSSRSRAKDAFWKIFFE